MLIMMMLKKKKKIDDDKVIINFKKIRINENYLNGSLYSLASISLIKISTFKTPKNNGEFNFRWKTNIKESSLSVSIANGTIFPKLYNRNYMKKICIGNFLSFFSLFKNHF